MSPDGFEHVCTQLVARHGSRALEGRKYDQLTMALWEQGKIDGATTELGDLFGEDLKEYIRINDHVGFVLIHILSFHQFPLSFF